MRTDGRLTVNIGVDDNRGYPRFAPIRFHVLLGTLAITMAGILGCAHQPGSYGDATRRYYSGMSMADATLVYGTPANISRQGGVTTARYHLDEGSRNKGGTDAFGINFRDDAAVNIFPLKFQGR